MKKTILVIVIITAVFVSVGIQAQDSCSKYYPMVEGSTFEYTNYDKKGKVEGITNYTISSVTSEGDATKATLDLKMSDKKGKELFTSNYSFSCADDLVKIDYKSLFPAEMMQQYANMDMELDITGSDIELPNELSVGKELADANVSITMNMSGIKMDISVDQTNRKVVSQENITTTAGSFECMVITETTSTKAVGATIALSSKLWLAEGVGMIKQETYKKNGDLMSKTELTRFSK